MISDGHGRTDGPLDGARWAGPLIISHCIILVLAVDGNVKFKWADVSAQIKCNVSAQIKCKKHHLNFSALITMGELLWEKI